MSDEERKILQLIHESKDPGRAAEIAIKIILDEIKRTDCHGLRPRNDRPLISQLR